MITDVLEHWNKYFKGKIHNDQLTFDNDIGNGRIDSFQLTEKLQLFRTFITLKQEVIGQALRYEDDDQYVTIMLADTCAIFFEAKENIKLKEGALIGNDKTNLPWRLPAKQSTRLVTLRVQKNYFDKMVERSEHLKSAFPIDHPFLVFEEMSHIMKGTYYRILEIQDSPYHRELIYSCGSYLFHLLFEQMSLKAKVKDEGKSTLNVQGVFLARNIINEKNGVGVSIEFLSRECGISKSHLRANFSKAFGISMYQYILGVKLAEAKKRILKGDKSLSRIAIDMEFSSSSHFTTSFKRAYGITPKEFQKQTK